MFRISLTITRKSESIMQLSPAILFRILFGIIGAVLLLGISLNPGTSIPVIGIILIIISFIAAFYEERWILNRDTRIIDYRFGLIFLCRKESIPFDEIDEFSYSDTAVIRRDNPEGSHSMLSRSSIFNGRSVKYSVLSLITKDGKVRNIEVLKSRSGTELLDKGTQAAGFCGYELKRS
ncbi:MAG: hypothetical protein JEY99_03750 [Spirochaetales bacterium]|nr:hypothetical protein [Spirochaetales bacterium]